MANRLGKRVTNLILVLGALVACVRQHGTLQYGSARVAIKEVRPGSLMITGRTIHSGACVENVAQVREAGDLRIVVTMGPIKGRCLNEFFAMIHVDPNLQTISLGVPGGKRPQELGVVWSKSPGPTIYCPPVCDVR
jgi:hypothetical protein